MQPKSSKSMSPTRSSIRRRTRASAPRTDRRHDQRVPVDLFINRFLDGQPYLCRMIDISRTGARLVPMIEPNGARAPQFMGLQFQLPDRNDVLTASGETGDPRWQDGRRPLHQPAARRGLGARVVPQLARALRSRASLARARRPS